MKCLVVITIVLLADVLLASPLKDQINDVLIADIPEEPVNRWTLIPDADGKLHLVDMNSYDEPIGPTYNAETDIIFLVRTRLNPTVGQQILLEDLASLHASNFNPGFETRITIHGWIGSAESTVNRNVAAQYFLRGDYNMITIDWSAGAGALNYITARNRVQETAAVIARFIDFLHLNGAVRFPDLHVIGHSLGGQVAGLIGKRVTRGEIQVILALDPAGPLFSLNDPNERVAPTDGVYVEVIHTNGGLLGFREPIGQVDIFPNFGSSQPGCGADVSGQCAHERVNELHAESINTLFTSHRCASFEEINNEQCTLIGGTVRMGGPYGNPGVTGNFFMTTNGEAPFSQG